MGCSGATHDEKENLETEIFELGNVYIMDGNYKQAWEIYSRFIMKFPTHAYVDDAAYRLAYIHVIVDDMNPYFDYLKASGLFKNFIENYPNSRYINACQNWINLLNSVKYIRDEQKANKAGMGANSVEIKRLKNELKRVRAENTRLKNTLEELQKAIER
jgi:tetratricopeptide (TPR) repeat protein